MIDRQNCVFYSFTLKSLDRAYLNITYNNKGRYSKFISQLNVYFVLKIILWSGSTLNFFFNFYFAPKTNALE